MKSRVLITLLAVLALTALMSCSDDDTVTPTTTQDPGTDEAVIADLSFNDFGADARQVLPPVYTSSPAKDTDMWHDGEYSLLGKVFSEDEPMSIHANIANHDMVMDQVEMFLDIIAQYEVDLGEIPTEPVAFTDPEHGSGTMTIHFAEATEAVAVPAVCQTVFGVTSVSVDYLLQIDCALDSGENYASPYFGFSASDEAQVLYYWSVGRSETGAPEGSQLFLATKDVQDDSFEIAGAYFKEDGPGDEERCNWVYHLTGNPDLEFTYNMGWYAECPDFDLFGCVEGSGDKDTEFGLCYHDYTDTSGWDTYNDWSASAEVFGPVADDPYAFIAEPERAGSIEDYIDPTIMYVRDDSPLENIPNPFATLFVE